MEKKQDSENEANLGLFVLRMHLSSESEADLEERENKMVVGPKNELMDEAEVPGQHEPQNDNHAHDSRSKAVAKRRNYKKKRVKWGARDEIVMCSAVVDGIKCGLQGVRSSADVIHLKKSEGFWDEVNKKLQEEIGKCVSRLKLYYKFRDTRRRFLDNKRNPNPQLNQHDKEVFQILAQEFGNGNGKKKKRGLSDSMHSDAEGDTAESDGVLEGKMLFPEKRLAKCTSKSHSYRHCTSCSSTILRTLRQQDAGAYLKNNGGDGSGMYQNKEISANIDVVKEHNADIGSSRKGEVGLDSSTIGSSGKRLKWDLKDDIAIASVVRDSVNCGLRGVSSAKDVTRFKTHKGFWDEVAEKLKEETGKCVSPWKFCTKFRSMKIRYLTINQSHGQQQNKHDEELFGILEEMFGNVRKQRLRHLVSPNSAVKGEISGGSMFSKRKSQKPLTTAQSSRLSTSSVLRNQNKRKNPERFLMGERTPNQDDRIWLKNRKEEVGLDSLAAGSSVKRLKWDLKDEIAVASAVQDAINCGVHGVTSLREALSFCKHGSFWTELAKKMKEEIGRYISTEKLFQKFRSMKYRYLAIKQSDIKEFNKHDKELFTVLEQVFGNVSCVTPHSDTKRLDKSGAHPFSGNEIQEKLYKQSGVSATENEPQLEHEKAIGQDGQTCNRLPFEVLSTDGTSMGAQIKQRKEVESCPNVVNGSTLFVPSLSLGNPSPCEGYQTGAAFTASTDHGVENRNGRKDKEHAGGKNKQLHDRISMLLNETEQNHEQGHHDMLSKSERKSGEWNGDQLVTDDILTGSRILEEPSDHQSDYAEVVKCLQRKSRKLQLMQELYKIERQEIEDRICQVKLKASGNP